MPPSPSVRRSPQRELRADNHKRGRSLEGGILFREKEDDLALFNKVQNRENDNFLLQSTDDFEDTFSTKLRYFSNHKLEIYKTVRGESSNLLNAEEKNDYDWLLTPPDTPLFPSLDDGVTPLNLPQRGRPQSQLMSISRSSTMDKSQRSSRGSASPNRLSLSPRSGSSTLQRGRTSSAPQSSPNPNLRHDSPLRKPSPPPVKSSPTRRSITPTPRRVSTSSVSTVASSGIRGISPVKTNRGNSASPKIRAWQSNIPGFPSEAPPNLRTSLADRPASYVRGSSPASRNGREFPSKSGRQSMSPTTTRSFNTSHSHDQDRFCSRSKGLIASSADDDVDFLVSIPAGSSERSSARRMSSLSNSRAPAFSKKTSRTVASNSAPKRSFDLALRQMELEKEKERQVTHVEFFKATHKRAFWTPAANRMKNVLVKLWDEYRASHTQDGGDESEAHTSSSITPPLSPIKRRRLEAYISSQASKVLGMKAHLKNRVFMEGRVKMSDIYGTDVPSTARIMMPRTEPAHLTDDLLQQAIGHAAVIAHARDNVSCVPRLELNAEIQQLAVEVITLDHAHFSEYIRFASMAVEKILGTNGKSIIEDDSPSDHGTESESDQNDNANL